MPVLRHQAVSQSRLKSKHKFLFVRTSSYRAAKLWPSTHQLPQCRTNYPILVPGDIYIFQALQLPQMSTTHDSSTQAFPHFANSEKKRSLISHSTLLSFDARGLYHKKYSRLCWVAQIRIKQHAIKRRVVATRCNCPAHVLGTDPLWLSLCHSEHFGNLQTGGGTQLGSCVARQKRANFSLRASNPPNMTTMTCGTLQEDLGERLVTHSISQRLCRRRT